MSSRPDSPSSEHVVDLVADYVFERLDAAQASQVRAHLKQCAECAADYEWAASFRAEGVHLSAERVVALSEGGAPSTRERDHLAGCDACRRELEVMRTLELPVAPRAVRAPRRRVRPRWQGWGLGALATAAVVVLLLQPWRAGIDLDAVRGLSQREALPVRVPRTVPEATEFEILRVRGLEAYADARPQDAVEALAQAAQLADDDEIRLYLGSARWLAGDEANAEQDLRLVVERASPGPVLEAARWQLANLYLGRGATDAAVSLLNDVTREGRRFRGAAQRLLDQLADLGVSTP